MRQAFTYKTLALAITTLGTATLVNAAGLDRSGQDVTAFLQDGTYAEAVYTYIDANVSGYDNGVASGASNESAYIKGKATGNVAETYDFFRFGVKADINDTFSVGVVYDEPFGAAVEHFGGSNFVSQGGDATINALTNGRVPSIAVAQGVLTQAQAGITQLKTAIATAKTAGQDTSTLEAKLTETITTATQLGSALNVAGTAETQKGQGTNVEIRTNNATLLLGAKLGANKNLQVYGGPAAQRLTGEVHLRGTAYQGATGYDARISPDTSYGWVAGVSYSVPKIALKAALTYRSEIEHSTPIAEVFPAVGATGTTTRDFKVTLPESYNLDFQTGVSPTMLLTAKARYVPWGKFDIRPPTYGDVTAKANNGTPLAIVEYSKDQWSAELGLGKKLSDKISVSGNIGYDSGAGNPVSTLGPIKGYYSVGLGAKYNLTPNWSVSAGGKYLKFGDATAQLPTKAIAGKFEKNDGYIVGVKLAYQDKK